MTVEEDGRLGDEGGWGKETVAVAAAYIEQTTSTRHVIVPLRVPTTFHVTFADYTQVPPCGLPATCHTSVRPDGSRKHM